MLSVPARVHGGGTTSPPRAIFPSEAHESPAPEWGQPQIGRRARDKIARSRGLRRGVLPVRPFARKRENPVEETRRAPRASRRPSLHGRLPHSAYPRSARIGRSERTPLHPPAPFARGWETRVGRRPWSGPSHAGREGVRPAASSRQGRANQTGTLPDGRNHRIVTASPQSAGTPLPFPQVRHLLTFPLGFRRHQKGPPEGP